MHIELKGTLMVINELEILTGKQFRKRTCVLATQEQYKQDLLIEFIQDATIKLNDYKVGDKVVIRANLMGRKWINPTKGDQYFISLQGQHISFNHD